MAQLKIYPLPLITVEIGKSMMTYLVGLKELFTNYVYSWYIEGTKQNILVDVGAPAETISEPTETILTPIEALNRVGTSPDKIDLVIFTHLHRDHIINAHLYKNAQFILQKAEREFAVNPHPIKKRFFRGVADIIKGLNLRLVEGDTQIVDGVRVLHTPGHTPGTQSVMVDTAKGKAIICGACTIRENFEPPEELRPFMPVIAPGVHLDAREAFASLLRIKNEADIVIPLHDPEFAQGNPIG
jgi:N-acyl homoserine lactone hydrolase